MKLLLVLLAAAASADPTVTVVPWCDNSFRVQITPAGSLGVDPPGGDPGEPYAALVKKCTVGTAAPLKAGGSATNGNLKIALSAPKKSPPGHQGGSTRARARAGTTGNLPPKSDQTRT